jgi:transposase
MTCPTIDNTASREIRGFICSLHAKNMSAAEIHCELCTVYGQNVMSEGTGRQWCRMFEGGQTNFHDEERSGRPSVVNDDLVQIVEQKICERRHFIISEVSREVPQILRTVLCEIIAVRIGYHKFCARWVPKILLDAHKT